ncbi:MAG: rRNA maturation RNase YbeY [Rhodobacteraceae bacterium]|nr:rRNA maturation RNase YbeY [Paracoccaceae bacterium]
MLIDLTLQDSRWTALNLQTLADTAATETLAHLNIAASPCDISLLACTDARIADLNRDFRNKPGATNVLSWPAYGLAAAQPGAMPTLPEADMTGEVSLGDIAIAFETCQLEAAEAGKPMADHVTHLIVHGVLHLLGFDHIRDPDATLMERLEGEILGNMGMDDPYRDIDGA